MIKSLCITACLLGMVIPAMTSAHEAPVHNHSQIVPIPTYELPHGEAGGNAASLAAQAFLAAFDKSELSGFVFPTNSQERTRWSNLPGGLVTRSGLSIGEMSQEQRRLLFSLLASSLSASGYDRLSDVLAAEAFLNEASNAARYGWFPENYWISFYGAPSQQGSWGWQFGGHHLGLNISVRNGQVYSMSPSFLGTEPAVFTLNRIDYESIVDMHHSGHALFQLLSDSQQAEADAGRVPRDIVTGPGRDGHIPTPIGISASVMTPNQRLALLETISLWVTIQPGENASTRIDEIKTDLDKTYFAWSGTTEVNTPVYLRIQGPSLIIELVSTGGNFSRNALGLGHYHTIYRNPNTEYGRT